MNRPDAITSALLTCPLDIIDDELRRKRWRNDPLQFVRDAWPWGQPGTICANMTGPDPVQERILTAVRDMIAARGRFDGRTPVAPLRLAVASGHGIGKSTVSAWLTCWIMATRPGCKGKVTAITFPQLETATWPAITRWARACSLFPESEWLISGSRFARRSKADDWYCSPQTCAEGNEQAFAGQHASTSTSFYIMDEASGIPDAVFGVAAGGMTDGEPMMLLFGNPVHRSGFFFRKFAGDEREQQGWTTITVDSRDSALTNKPYIDELLETHGENSDYFRSRVRGLPPLQGDMQLISSSAIFEAQKRAVDVLPDEPLIAGVDVSRGGGDNTVVRFRRGRDGRSRESLRWSGDQSRDSMRIADALAQVLAVTDPARKVAMMFVDAGFGGPIVDRLRQLGFSNVQEVNFGAVSPDPHYANMRAYMWVKMRDWLESGAIEGTKAESGRRLERDLSGPGYVHNSKDKLLLESKDDMAKRGIASPDDGDALALTFARPVAAPQKRPEVSGGRMATPAASGVASGWV